MPSSEDNGEEKLLFTSTQRVGEVKILPNRRDNHNHPKSAVEITSKKGLQRDLNDRNKKEFSSTMLMRIPGHKKGEVNEGHRSLHHGGFPNFHSN
jgi:hypothetical protein